MEVSHSKAIFSRPEIFENMAPIENLKALFGGSNLAKESISGVLESVGGVLDYYLATLSNLSANEIFEISKIDRSVFAWRGRRNF